MRAVRDREIDDLPIAIRGVEIRGYKWPAEPITSKRAGTTGTKLLHPWHVRSLWVHLLTKIHQA